MVLTDNRLEPGKANKTGLAVFLTLACQFATPAFSIMISLESFASKARCVLAMKE